ncbi:MAG: tRNA 2-thiouridine(34) synthase MnmA [Thiobacillus sp. SCN 63-1177]|nr:MAG: tRNA 2-thiouridine(34) synthase MnmA [Thiobacillus sp. SCN 63-1177]
MSTKVVVGLSGGVDSAVAAYLLKQQGFDVLGVFMKNWDDDDNTEQCTARQDFLDVLAVAEVLGIEVEAVNFAAEYKERVFSYFLAEHQAGRTPNPDVLCNAEIKFKAFLDDAIARGAEFIATGHYVGKGADDAGRATLLRAQDGNKDQSYFLYRLSQAQLTPALFPLAQLPKPEVRRIAARIGLPNAHPGEMQTPDGRVVGRHQGLMYYTLGQRQGLGIGGQKDGSAEPWFVAAKDMATNTLIVVQGHDHPLLLRSTLAAGQLSWIAGVAPDPDRPYTAKTRYRQTDAACRITKLDAGAFELAFDTPQWAVTPGQSVVLYDGEVCLGGGVIS